MNKNIIVLIGFVLVGIIAYQAYLLGKKEASSVHAAQKVEKAEPKITVEIEKPEPTATHQPRAAATESNATGFDPKELEAKIKEDFGHLVKDIFGNPKVKAEIQQNMQQMQSQMEEGVSEMQKAIIAMTRELQKASKEDPVLAEIFGSMPLPKALAFEDNGSRYTLTLDVPKDAKSSVDVKVKNGMLIVTIHQVVQEAHEENGVMVKKELTRKKEVLVTVPEDAMIEKLETKYDDGKLRLIVPKLPKPKANA